LCRAISSSVFLPLEDSFFILVVLPAPVSDFFHLGQVNELAAGPPPPPLLLSAHDTRTFVSKVSSSL